MHEYALIAGIVRAVEKTVRADKHARVREVRYRTGGAHAPDALRQAFELTTRGTPLEGATLTIEAVATPLTCGCGHHESVSADDIVGHLWVCPHCGGIIAVADQDEVEVVLSG
jgi:Zn finger protein HypA/HybF involved in hydrogenase expression